jgi:hypothetical protein
MLFRELKHLLARLTRLPYPASASYAASNGASSSFNPSWHGDHWQNLLSSPMDARHYVLYDWDISVPESFDAAPLGVAHS